MKRILKNDEPLDFLGFSHQGANSFIIQDGTLCPELVLDKKLNYLSCQSLFFIYLFIHTTMMH